MTGLARIAEDACLLILEEHGVFFSELRQELHVFNTPATFIWCCLEEGLGASEAVAAYAETFGVDPADAHRQIADLLHRWQGLGYVSGVDVDRELLVQLVEDVQALDIPLACAWDKPALLFYSKVNDGQIADFSLQRKRTVAFRPSITRGLA